MVRPSNLVLRGRIMGSEDGSVLRGCHKHRQSIEDYGR
jgi:hypothetical protein